MSEHLNVHKDGTPEPCEWYSHPIEITHAAMFEQKVEYIHNNPVKEGGLTRALRMEQRASGESMEDARGCAARLTAGGRDCLALGKAERRSFLTAACNRAREWVYGLGVLFIQMSIGCSSNSVQPSIDGMWRAYVEDSTKCYWIDFIEADSTIRITTWRSDNAQVAEGKYIFDQGNNSNCLEVRYEFSNNTSDPSNLPKRAYHYLACLSDDTVLTLSPLREQTLWDPPLKMELRRR